MTSQEPVVVFSADKQASLVVARTLLEDAGIRFVARNELVQDLVGLGQWSSFNPATGPVELLVSPEDLEVARELLNRAFDDDPCT